MTKTGVTYQAQRAPGTSTAAAHLTAAATAAMAFPSKPMMLAAAVPVLFVTLPAAAATRRRFSAADFNDGIGPSGSPLLAFAAAAGSTPDDSSESITLSDWAA